VTTRQKKEPAQAGFFFFCRQPIVVAIAFAAVMTLPWLGMAGLFDPWETHYAEVSRQMVVRDDCLHPFWKDAWFFSKPVLLFWLQAPLFVLLGTDVASSPWVECAMRLPVAMLSASTLITLFVVVRQLKSARAAWLSVVVLASSPMWAMMSRHATTDMPYASTFSMAMLLSMLVWFGDVDAIAVPRWMSAIFGGSLLWQGATIARSATFLDDVWWFGDNSERVTRTAVGIAVMIAVVVVTRLWHRHAVNPTLQAAAWCLALSCLAKGPIGVVLGVATVMVFVLVTGDKHVLLPRGLGAAAVTFAAVAAPWPTTMLLFAGVDDSQRTWFARFVLHDLLGRVGGVHGERGGLEYYIRTLTFGWFPWMGLALPALAHSWPRATARKDAPTTFVLAWFVVVAAFFTATGTKFHHYILPLLVPGAMLIAIFVDDLLDTASVHARQVLKLTAVVFAGVGVVAAREILKSPWEMIDLFTYHYKGYKPEYYLPIDKTDLVTFQWLLPELGVVSGFRGLLAAQIAVVVAGVAVGVLSGAYRGQRGIDAIRGLAAGAIAGTAILLHAFVPQASEHWSQRALVNTYNHQKKGDEPLIAFQMDWKGETFYSSNQEVQIRTDTAALRRFADEPGRVFIVVQTDRLAALRSALGAQHDASLQVVDARNAKWRLVVVE
jgi:4-amino-4-deoxy-L-arabinose transferase-like glycosyltransferase